MGAAVGVAVSWRALKSKYEREAQEQIAAMREALAKKNTTNNTEKTVEDIPPCDDDEEFDEHPDLDTVSVKECERVVTNLGYANYSDYSSTDKEDARMNEPYVIPPEEYGEKEGYDLIELTYWEDGVVTDDLDEPIYDIERTIGYDSLRHFGEYEEDSVFVRNDKRRADYQILYDGRKYSTVILEV
jgi:hypothetical protein